MNLLSSMHPLITCWQQLINVHEKGEPGSLRIRFHVQAINALLQQLKLHIQKRLVGDGLYSARNLWDTLQPCCLHKTHLPQWHSPLCMLTLLAWRRWSKLPIPPFVSWFPQTSNTRNMDDIISVLRPILHVQAIKNRSMARRIDSSLSNWPHIFSNIL